MPYLPQLGSNKVKVNNKLIYNMKKNHKVILMGLELFNCIERKKLPKKVKKEVKDNKTILPNSEGKLLGNNSFII